MTCARAVRHACCARVLVPGPWLAWPGLHASATCSRQGSRARVPRRSCLMRQAAGTSSWTPATPWGTGDCRAHACSCTAQPAAARGPFQGGHRQALSEPRVMWLPQVPARAERPSRWRGLPAVQPRRCVLPLPPAVAVMAGLCCWLALRKVCTSDTSRAASHDVVPAGFMLATVAADGRVSVYVAGTGSLLARQQTAAPVHGLAFCGSGGGDGTSVGSGGSLAAVGAGYKVHAVRDKMHCARGACCSPSRGICSRRPARRTEAQS